MKKVAIEYTVSVYFDVPDDWTDEEIQEAIDAVVVSPYFHDYDSPEIPKHSIDADSSLDWASVDGRVLP